MNSIIPLRVRLTAWYALMLALGLGIFALSLWVLVNRHLRSAIDQTLADRVSGMARYIEDESRDNTLPRLREELREYANSTAEGNLIQVRGSGGVLLGDDRGVPMPSQSRPGEPVLGKAIYRGHPYRTITTTATINGAEYVISAAASLEFIDHLLRRVELVLIGAIPLVLIGASCGGYWISRRALAPVDQMTTAAQEIGISNLSQRLKEPGSRDELQRLAETWNRMLARLEAAVSQLSRFTADASHELRTPITLIRTAAELALRRERSTESYRQTLVKILDEAQRMSTLVEDLLSLARSDVDADYLALETIDLRSVVSQAGDQGRMLAEAKDIQYALYLPDEALIVQGHGAALRRLVLALVDNAVKFTPSYGRVAVTLSREGESAVLAISDSGIGIPTEVLPHIFDRFYRADPSRNREIEGHGLGLSLARWVADRHRAAIQVESSSGRGSTFSVRFPVRVSEQTPLLAANPNS